MRARLVRRRIAAVALLAAAVVLPLGCGGKYQLPTEVIKPPIPLDKSYQMLQTWSKLPNLQDVLLVQGLVITLYNWGGSGHGERGKVVVYPLARPTELTGVSFPTLFNPVGLGVGGDGKGHPANTLFVLDQGDSCLARANPITGMCDDTTGDWNLRVRDFTAIWRVREYGLYGGDTISTFTDTTMAWVRSVSGDADGNVYVSGLAIVLLEDQQDPRIRTRMLQSRIYRYIRGPRYPGVNPPDWRMPGANWHRDTSWVVEEGSGLGTVQDAHGIEWGPYAGGSLMVSDYGKNWIQKLNVTQANTGIFQIGESGDPVSSFFQPADVATDAAGFIYICDNGNRRIVRHDPGGAYVQRVDIEPDADGQPLLEPIAVTANDSLVYVADHGRNEIIRYKRRQ
jgi:hypothetical protein